MTRVIILKGNIDDGMWPELIFAITYIRNNRPTRVLQNLSPHKILLQKFLTLSYLQILGSRVYVLLHKEAELMKSEKWTSRALNGVLVGYYSHIIHRVYIKDQKKVIMMNDLCIFRDYETKSFSKLPNYNDKPNF